MPRFTPGLSRGLELPGDTRREDRHQDDVAVRAGSLDRESPPDARSRHALRSGPLARDRRHHRRGHEHHRSASGRDFDARRSGRTTVQGSYGHYSGKYGQVQFSSNSNVSRPSEVDYVYSGPAGAGQRVRARSRSRELHRRRRLRTFRRRTCKVAKGLQSPIVRELRWRSAASSVSRRTQRRPTYGASTSNFVEDFVSLSNGVRQRAARGPAHQSRARQHRRAAALVRRRLIFQTDFRMVDRIWTGARLHAAAEGQRQLRR